MSADVGSLLKYVVFGVRSNRILEKSQYSDFRNVLEDVTYRTHIWFVKMVLSSFKEHISFQSREFLILLLNTLALLCTFF